MVTVPSFLPSLFILTTTSHIWGAAVLECCKAWLQTWDLIFAMRLWVSSFHLSELKFLPH